VSRKLGAIQSLHIDDSNDTCFDNIHIVLNAHQPDYLLMGFSRLINKIDDSSLTNIVSEFNDLLESEAFSIQKEKVLIAKKDNYLLDHDINDILEAKSSLDTNLDRFRFVFFIGYESDQLRCNAKEMADDYELRLKSEVTIKFKSLVDKMIYKDEFYKDLHIEAYLYPIPSLSTLISEIQTQVTKEWKLV
jgi:glycosyltransferase involved in cell wall biosynthesis